MVQAGIRVTAPPKGEKTSRRAPRKARWGRPSPSLSALLELGMIDEVEARIASSTDRLDALTWANMRSLLLGHREPAAAGIEKLGELARTGQAREPWERYWIQRFWAAFEWGGRDERLDVLEHCRERAYRFDELHWWANLTLLLAATGTHEEAFSAFDETRTFVSRVPKDHVWLDELTNLIEAAALLGDPDRLAACHRALRWPDGRVVVVGNGIVCKGSVDRYKALGYAALGKQKQADRYFRRAEALHLEIGAGPLLARTRHQAGGSLLTA
jgi:tetratricopeptide (TPR) repeat protein